MSEQRRHRRNNTYRTTSVSSETDIMRTTSIPEDLDEIVNINEETSLIPRNGPPKDNYNLVYWIFGLLGMSTLLPWNFFISVNSFWDYKFRNVSLDLIYLSEDENDQTELQRNFTSYLAIASNVPTAIFVVLNAVYGTYFRLSVRILGSLSLIISLFIIICVLSLVNSDHWQKEFLYSVLILVVLTNVNTAIYQGAVYGTAGKFPPEYMGVVMSGTAIGGIFPALANIVVLGFDVIGPDVGFACFFIATVILSASLICFLWLRKSEFFLYYNHDENTTSHGHGIAFYIRVFRQSWKYCLSVFMTFTVTLSVFPAITVLIESFNVKTPWGETYFIPVTCFLLFNVCDYLGRVASSRILWPKNTKMGQNLLIFFSVLRWAFVPLFMLCNASPKDRSLPVVFNHDADYILLMVLFGLSNGYVGGLCMIEAPKTSENIEYQEVTAMIMVAFLCLGTGTGSFLSYPFVSAI